MKQETQKTAIFKRATHPFTTSQHPGTLQAALEVLSGGSLLLANAPPLGPWEGLGSRL
ncbi:hypothetical protein T439DRAFT_326080, partial [Meredithblackwellia eburnea MCA 4105]